MTLRLDAAYLLTGFLIFLRISAVFMFTPLFSAFQIPMQFRLLFLIALAFVLLGALHVPSITAPITLGALVPMAIIEVLIGAILAFGVMAAFAAFQVGGRVLDYQIGFGLASVIDPQTREDSALLGTALHSLAVLIFFAVDGHHMVLRGLSYTLTQLPPGSGLFDFQIAPIVTHFGMMFVYGFSVVAPVILVLLLVDVGMALISRNMPQVNVFIIGMPVKVLVGLITFALSMRYMGGLLERIYASIFKYWQAVVP
jgi:flagellar biosynthetic protein FliR